MKKNVQLSYLQYCCYIRTLTHTRSWHRKSKYLCLMWCGYECCLLSGFRRCCQVDCRLQTCGSNDDRRISSSRHRRIHSQWSSVDLALINCYKRCPQNLPTGLLAESTTKWCSHVFIKKCSYIAHVRLADYTGWSKETVPQFYFCDNFRKCTPILTIFSLLEPEIYDA